MFSVYGNLEVILELQYMDYLVIKKVTTDHKE